MNKIKLITFSILLSLLCFSVKAATPLVAAVSENNIDIHANFTGKKILLFGARNEAGEILILVRGPKKSFITRKKEKILGLWLNKDYLKFNDLNSFYAVYSSVPLEKFDNHHLNKNLGIGLDNIIKEYSGSASIDEISNFREALLEYQFDNGLFQEDIGEIEYLNDTLFKSEIIFPKKIIKGIYSIDIFLINENRISAMQSNPISVKKVGFESLIYHAAHERSFLYGFIAIFIALLFGWISSIIFWKR